MKGEGTPEKPALEVAVEFGVVVGGPERQLVAYCSGERFQNFSVDGKEAV